MRRNVLVSLALVAFSGVLFVLTREERTRAPAPSAPPVAEARERDGLDPAPAVRPPGPEPIVPASARTEMAPVEERSAITEHPACIVLGRVVDQEGQPLAGVAVRLQAYRTWADGVDVPRLEGRSDMRGFETRTDVSGSFRLEAPPPTVPRTSLEVRPDRFHDLHTIRFAATGDGAEPQLTAGVRDVGEIRLATTGAVRGRVTSADGRPLADVEMDVGPGPSLTYQRGGWTEADGTYVVAHAPVGTYATKAKADGYLSGYVEPVTVEPGRDTVGVDFVLEPAPSIEGIVRDRSGRPLAGVRLHGWPASSGSGASGKSGADGRFVVWLPQDEPYTLSAKLDGYRTWGDEHARDTTHAPGTRDLEIVMESMPRTRFAVVDAETGAPIERFGLNILENNGSESRERVYTERRRPPESDHPGGLAEATARPGVDLYVVAAQGYLLASDDVRHDGPDELVQTVRLERGATVRGRVLDGDGVVAGARIEIERGDVRVLGGTEVFHVSDNTRLATVTDGAGRFLLDALEDGTHRLTIHPPERGAPLVTRVELGHREALDLGDLVLGAGAAIAGRVVLPPGIAPAGLQVHLDGWRDGATAVVDGAGRFGFEDLAAGPHTLALEGRPGELAASEPVAIELAPGETTSVTLDARDRAMCEVVLEIELSGVPVTGRQVDLAATGGSLEDERLGECDPAGLVRGWVRAWGEARVVVYLSGRRIEHPTARLQLDPGGRVERAVRFDFARVELSLPPGVELPTDGAAQLGLAPTDPDQIAQRARLRFVERKPNEEPGLGGTRDGALFFGALMPGRFELSLALVHDDAELQRIPVGDGRFRIEKAAYYRAVRDVVLVAGETAVLSLE